jgi:putative glycerol-1-phosphate prenyltransferase
MTTFEKLFKIRESHGAGYFVLLDPDKRSEDELVSVAEECEACGVDGLLVGGSLLFSVEFDNIIKSIKGSVSIPVILFPGSSRQLSKYADAVLFISIISGRNPHYLIGEQVLSAPLIKSLGLETISTGYMIVESATQTAVEFMSNTRPLPRERPEIAVAHALAAEYLGMKMIYMEAGSGASQTVPEEMIKAVSLSVSIPVIVGGGIKRPETAVAKIRAGASFIVTGNILESSGGSSLIKEFVQAIHDENNMLDRDS